MPRRLAIKRKWLYAVVNAGLVQASAVRSLRRHPQLRVMLAGLLLVNRTPATINFLEGLHSHTTFQYVLLPFLLPCLFTCGRLGASLITVSRPYLFPVRSFLRLILLELLYSPRFLRIAASACSSSITRYAPVLDMLLCPRRLRVCSIPDGIQTIAIECFKM